MRKSERKKEFDIFDTKLKFSFLVRPIDGPILFRKQIQTTTIQFQRDKKSLIRWKKRRFYFYKSVIALFISMHNELMVLAQYLSSKNEPKQD